MKSHVLRPLMVTLGLVALILIARVFYVPKDFGIGERGYMYGWHRGANEEEWKQFKVKFMGSEYCKDCHDKNYSSIKKTPHRIILCEDCHGPAGTPEGIMHYDPDRRPKLTIDKSRSLCLRCHFPLPYPTSLRSKIKGIDPEMHNPGIECSTCHNPHNPMEGLR